VVDKKTDVLISKFCLEIEYVPGNKTAYTFGGYRNEIIVDRCNGFLSVQQGYIYSTGIWRFFVNYGIIGRFEWCMADQIFDNP